MKDKIILTDILTASEKIARAMRAYSGESLACDVFIETREKDPHEGTDVVTVRLMYNSEDEHGEIFGAGWRISYTFDNHEGELIKDTVRIFGEEFGGDDDDPQS